jgi:hypothetical protein
MLRGKFWITPDGVFDVSATEHKIFARKKMLCLDDKTTDYPSARTAFTWMPCDHEIASLLVKPGVDRLAVAWLREGQDERLYAMKYWGWVRTARNAFNAWRLDDKTLELIRHADKYWYHEQGVFETGAVVDFLETFSWREGEIPLCYFIYGGPEIKAVDIRKQYFKKAGVKGVCDDVR